MEADELSGIVLALIGAALLVGSEVELVAVAYPNLDIPKGLTEVTVTGDGFA